MAKSRMYSVLTTLPALMLFAGFYIYYSGEKAQRTSPLIMPRAEVMSGSYKGLTAVGSGSWGRHYLWLEVAGEDGNRRRRSARITADEALFLSAPEYQSQAGLDKNNEITVYAAPTVADSNVLWVYQLVKGERVIFGR